MTLVVWWKRAKLSDSGIPTARDSAAGELRSLFFFGSGRTTPIKKEEEGDDKNIIHINCFKENAGPIIHLNYNIRSLLPQVDLVSSPFSSFATTFYFSRIA